MAQHRLIAGRVADDRPAARLTAAIRRFMELEIASGVVLMAAVVAAITWANSPWSGAYAAFWKTPVRLALGPFGLEATLHHAVDDGLMVLCFFVVGLEVKRWRAWSSASSRRWRRSASSPAWPRAEMLADAKVAILLASSTAGIGGLLLLRGPRAIDEPAS